MWLTTEKSACNALISLSGIKHIFPYLLLYLYFNPEIEEAIAKPSGVEDVVTSLLAVATRAIVWRRDIGL